ncbi:TraB/GumN family protein [Candidatus Woesearchaeota archaeon]|nr:TraB/GumN family protein [Candidatus Woesearchaeota archaeon]
MTPLPLQKAEVLHIIGTSHISKQSIREIKEAILLQKPDIVAVELDAERAYVLMHGEKTRLSLKDILHIGVKGFIFAKIGQILQQKLGKMVGVSPGTEMKTALEEAQKNKIPIALIDQPIKVTLKNFSKNLTWREKFRFLGDIIKGVLFPKRQLKEAGLEDFDLTKVPEKKLIAVMMKQLKQRYPNVYKTLVEDRNQYMVKKIIKLLRENSKKKILVVVGAGHKEGMEELLLKVDVI